MSAPPQAPAVDLEAEYRAVCGELGDCEVMLAYYDKRRGELMERAAMLREMARLAGLAALPVERAVALPVERATPDTPIS